MKIKDLVKLPGLMDCECPPKSECTCDLGLMTGRNDAIQEIGNMEISTMSVEEVLDCWKIVGSAHVPISKINGKTYYYMCKEDLAERICAKFPTPSKPVCDCCKCDLSDFRLCPNCTPTAKPVKEELDEKSLEAFKDEVSADFRSLNYHLIIGRESIPEYAGALAMVCAKARFFKNEKQELDEDAIVEILNTKSAVKIPTSGTFILNSRELAKLICSKFAVPNKPELQSVPSIEEIDKIIEKNKWFTTKKAMSGEQTLASSKELAIAIHTMLTQRADVE